MQSGCQGACIKHGLSTGMLTFYDLLQAAGDQEEGEAPPPPADPEGPTAPPQEEPEEEETVVEEAEMEASVMEMDIASTDSDIVEIQVRKKGIATSVKDYLCVGAGVGVQALGKKGKPSVLLSL